MRVMKKVAPIDPVKELAKEITAEIEIEWKKQVPLKVLWHAFCIKKGLKEKPEVAPVVYSPYVPLLEVDLTKPNVTGIGNLNGSSNLNQRYPKHTI